MIFLSILKHFQVISSESRQMRKNAQIADRPTDRPGLGNELLIATKNKEIKIKYENVAKYRGFKIYSLENLRFSGF